MEADNIPTIEVIPHTGKGGRPKNTVNLHSKFPSGIAFRLRKHGIDWVKDLAEALKTNNEIRISMWMRMLPYLVVTQGMKRVKKSKGRASRAALDALSELEGR